MSGSVTGLLHQQIACGEYEQAVKTAPDMAGEKSATFTDFVGAIQHAVNARQPEIAVALLDGSRRFFVAMDADALRLVVGEMTAVLASCWREKMDDPARTAVTLVLELLSSADYPVTKAESQTVAQFASWAGRVILRKNDMAVFREIALQTSQWAARNMNEQAGEAFLPAFDSWMHRILRQGRTEAVPVLFEALSIFISAVADQKIVLEKFLREWRVIATAACLNTESPLASQMVEQLLLFTVRSENPEFWKPVSEKIGEVAVLAVVKHDVATAFPVFRPLMDVGRVNLGDELKFGTGPDPDNKRQRIIRLVCLETLKIADMAAHMDLASVAGDKIEEMYQSWANDPQYESQIRSIQRFCQLLLIYWTNNRKRASKKWTPRAKNLSEPLLLTEEDRTKLIFLL